MRRPASIPIDTVAAFLGHIDLACHALALDETLACLVRAIAVLDPPGKAYFGFYRRDAPPIVLDTGEPDAWNRSYPDGYYLLDPCYEAFLRLEADTCLLPQDVYPPAFRRSEFYLSYYRPMGMVDEVCYLLRIGPDVAAYVSVMRLGAARRFTRGECAVLRMALPALAIAMRHVHTLFAGAPLPADEEARALHRHLSAAFADFGHETLSEREAEVTRLLLKGLAPKVVGSMLDIAPGTVRNHIKSIYAKLGVRSQAELLAAFFDALAARAGGLQ
jgi:DNA-binding CsgD family transcriptional regulator